MDEEENPPPRERFMMTNGPEVVWCLIVFAAFAIVHIRDAFRILHNRFRR